MHPDRHHRKEALGGGEFPFAFAQAGVGDVQERFGQMACALHGPKHLRKEAEDGAGKVLSFSGGPAVESPRPP